MLAVLGSCLIVGSAGTAGATETTSMPISAQALDDHDCNATEWHFIINQIGDGLAPETITVTWSNGETADLTLFEVDDDGEGPQSESAAHYYSNANLDQTVTSAIADIYPTWSGRFVVSHGPCGPSTPAPCTAGEDVVGGECVAKCEAGEVRNAAGGCEIPEVIDTGCPVGSVMVDGKCESPTIVTPVVDVPVVLPDTGVTPKPTPATPAQPGTPGTPATPAVPSVLPETVTPTVVPAVASLAAPAPATEAVLGAQVTRAPLARTGSSSTGLAAFGSLLVLLGASFTVAGRRTART